MRKRNAVTHISVCNKNDRFYLARDNTKKVWQVVYHTSKMIRGDMRSVTVCKDDTGNKKTFMACRMIIYLSNLYTDKKKMPIPKQIKAF